MTYFMAFFSMAAVGINLLVAFVRPVWAFYIYLTFVTFSHVFAGYIGEANYLGLPLAWTPPDFMFPVMTIVAFSIPKGKLFKSTFIEKCVIALCVLSIISMIQGLILDWRSALTESRVVHLVPAGIFALRYFTDYHRVNRFLQFAAGLIIVMFFVHVLIRFRLFVPPTSEISYTTQLGGERGSASLVPVLYLVLISIGIGRLVSKTGFFGLTSIFMIIIGAVGIVLGETRSTFGAMAILIAASLIFVKDRIKTAIIYGISGVVILAVLGTIQYDFLSRFRGAGVTGTGLIEMPEITDVSRNLWRIGEYGAIIQSYRAEPYFLATGRGIGAYHMVPEGLKLYVSGYHSEYLGWLDRCGVIGLFVMLVMSIGILLRSLLLSRMRIPQLQYYAVTAFLMVLALLAEGIFHPILSHQRGSALIISILAIIANWRYLYQSITDTDDERDENVLIEDQIMQDQISSY